MRVALRVTRELSLAENLRVTSSKVDITPEKAERAPSARAPFKEPVAGQNPRVVDASARLFRRPRQGGIPGQAGRPNLRGLVLGRIDADF